MAAQDEGIAHKVTDICSQKTVYYQRTLQDLVEAGIIDKNTDTQAKADEIFAFIVGQLIMARIKNDLKYLEENLEKALFDLIGVSQQHYGSEKLRA